MQFLISSTDIVFNPVHIIQRHNRNLEIWFCQPKSFNDPISGKIVGAPLVDKKHTENEQDPLGFTGVTNMTKATE